MSSLPYFGHLFLATCCFYLSAVSVLEASPASSRLYNSEESIPGTFRFVASIQYKGTPNTPLYFKNCSGSLIAPGVVLTSASCLMGKTSKNIDVILGAHDLRLDTAQHHAVRSVHIHPDWDLDWPLTDIAFLSLKEHSSIEPVELLTSFDASTASVGQEVTLLGWNMFDRYSTSERVPLQESSVRIQDMSRCESLIGKDNSNFLCAGTRADPSLAFNISRQCDLNFGGPMLLKEGGQTKQLALTSWSFICGTERYRGLFTNLRKLGNWATSGVLVTNEFFNSIDTIREETILLRRGMTSDPQGNLSKIQLELEVLRSVLKVHREPYFSNFKYFNSRKMRQLQRRINRFSSVIDVKRKRKKLCRKILKLLRRLQKSS